MSSSIAADQKQQISAESIHLDIQTLMQKIAEIELEQEEHKMVIDTLKEMELTRPAYKLINGILVEKTVGVVLPMLESQLVNITSLVDTLKEQLTKKQQELIKLGQSPLK